MKNITINRLKSFREKEKFAIKEWEKRGLNPSNSDFCIDMDSLLNICVDTLIEAVERNSNRKKIKRKLKEGLTDFTKISFDTEEREFICDYFFELSEILDVNIKNSLNIWLYGLPLNLIIRFTSIFKKTYNVI